MTDEGYVALEENASKEVEAPLRSQSTPWNIEVACGIRQEGTEYVNVVRLGIPTAAFPGQQSPCPGTEPTIAEEQAEVAEYKKQREEKKGCYASIPAPAGCVRMTAVEPANGLEVAFGGTLHLQQLNGSHNGLSATRWKLEGGTSGELQCEFPVACTASASLTGELRLLGYRELQLVIIGNREQPLAIVR
jgi:hypothetical protein